MTAQADVKRYELLIGGEAVAPGGGAYSSIIDPSTETPIASVAQGTAADVDRAVQAARAALKPWNAIRASERGRILMRFAELMRTHQDEIAAVESLDAGKPISGVRRQDVPAAIDTLAYYAGWC
ncbi:MAG TPA: aldehyde dehydrogenase family protein, partial [Caballeronia sp.]|nr:aldehyde dehydrogenase family protein [Caballeronia sp.]